MSAPSQAGPPFAPSPFGSNAAPGNNGAPQGSAPTGQFGYYPPPSQNNPASAPQNAPQGAYYTPPSAPQHAQMPSPPYYPPPSHPGNPQKQDTVPPPSSGLTNAGVAALTAGVAGAAAHQFSGDTMFGLPKSIAIAFFILGLFLVFMVMVVVFQNNAFSARIADMEELLEKVSTSSRSDLLYTRQVASKTAQGLNDLRNGFKTFGEETRHALGKTWSVMLGQDRPESFTMEDLPKTHTLDNLRFEMPTYGALPRSNGLQNRKKKVTFDYDDGY